MNIESTVKTVKTRATVLSARGQNLARISFKTLCEANDIVVEGVQALIKGNTEAARELFEQTRTGVDRARADGVRAVFNAPLHYLPPRKEIVGVLADQRKTVVKTGEDLFKLVRKGFDEAAHPRRRGAASAKRKTGSRRRKATTTGTTKRAAQSRTATAASTGGHAAPTTASDPHS